MLPSLHVIRWHLSITQVGNDTVILRTTRRLRRLTRAARESLVRVLVAAAAAQSSTSLQSQLSLKIQLEGRKRKIRKDNVIWKREQQCDEERK